MKHVTKIKCSILSAIIASGGFYSNSSYSSEIVTREFDSTQVKLISIENGSGNIQLSSHTKNVITVEASIVSGTKETCDVQIEKNSKEVFVKTKSKKTSSLFFSNKCEVNVVIKGPRSTDLNIKNGSGDVQVSNVDGTLNAKNGSGHLSAKGSFSEVSISVGSGDVSVSGVKGPGHVNVGSGDAEFTYSSLPAAGDLRVNLGSGNLTLLLPKRSSVQTRVRMGSGSLKNQLDNSTPGKFSIDGNIGSGDLILRNTE